MRQFKGRLTHSEQLCIKGEEDEFSLYICCPVDRKTYRTAQTKRVRVVLLDEDEPEIGELRKID